MPRFLILYGEDNEMATFEADDAAHAVEMFCSWAPVASDPDDNCKTINEVNLCCPVIGWDADERTSLYATGNDGSWFHANDLEIVTVPTTITDADEIEDFIVNHRGED